MKLGVRRKKTGSSRKACKAEEWVVVAGLLRAIPGRQVTPEKSPGSKPDPERRSQSS